MAPQLVADYAIDHPIGTPGGIAKLEGLQLGSVLAEVAIPVGRAVVRSDTALQTDRGILPDTTGAYIFGVAMRDLSKQSDAAQLLDYAVGDDVGLIREGYAYVLAEEATLAGDPVFIRFVAGGGGSLLGSFRTDADTASAYAWTAAKWVTTTLIATVGVIFIGAATGV